MKSSEQLTLAQNEKTPEAILIKLWDTSKSVRVRKAIAKNPNAGPKVLRSAARLYLEEVLENPGFFMLELFDEDAWIKNLSEAYSNPEEFIDGLWHRSVISKHQLGWACLLSPQLTSRAVNVIAQYVPSATFKRAIKNKSVLNNVKLLYQNSLTSLEVWPFDLETILVLYRENIISSEELYSGLSNYGVASAPTRKSTFNKVITQLIKKYISTKESFIAKLLAKMFLVLRHYALGWLSSNETLATKLYATGSLFAEVLSHMKRSYGSSSLSKESFNIIGEIVSMQIKFKFFRSANDKQIGGDYYYTPDQITQVYDFMKSHDLVSAPFSSYGLIHGKSAIDALIACRDEVKEFFIRSGCVGSWVSALGSDPKYALVNEVNEAIFLREGISDNLLFKFCSLRKVVSLSESTHIF